MSENVKPDDNGHGHEPIPAPGGAETPKETAREVVAIAVTSAGRVLVKGKLADEKNLILTALGEAIKIVANYEKPMIVKPDFIGGVRNMLRKR